MCSTVGGVQFRGDIMMHVGVILSTVGGYSVPWGMMMHVPWGDTILCNLSTVGDIICTVLGVQYSGVLK